MFMTLEEFRRRGRTDINGLVRDLHAARGSVSTSESKSWRKSLRRLARILDPRVFPSLQIYLAPGHIELEYLLPTTSCRADVVLLGAHGGKPAVVFMEIKDWDIREDRPGEGEGLITRGRDQWSHPSDQVRGYVNRCRYFHSAVQDFGATVHGCVLFTGKGVTDPYSAAPNDVLTQEFPIFTLSGDDLKHRLPEYLASRLTAPHPEFAAAFGRGQYRQQRILIQELAARVRAANTYPFELLGEQRRGLALCKLKVERLVEARAQGRRQRKVMIVLGPPGSGKSAIAVLLCAELSNMKGLEDGDLTIVTTTDSQYSNWAGLIDRAGSGGMRGVVRKANSFMPVQAFRARELTAACGAEVTKSAASWRTNLVAVQESDVPFADGAHDNSTLVSIVDEAHALIDPARDGGKGMFGFLPGLGPQGYHIIRSSALTVFFLDPRQGFRYRENTTHQDLCEWARELGADEIEMVSLDGMQFRCAGSVEYVDWWDSVLAGAAVEENAILAGAWFVPLAGSAASPPNVAVIPDSVARDGENRRIARTQPFDLRVFASPFAMEQALEQRIQEDNTARLASTFARRWVTKGLQKTLELAVNQQDFCEPIAGSPAPWHRSWNVVPEGNDYSWFIQGVPGSQIARNPLAEVGCPYVIRGWDYEYVGVLWLEDLVWRRDRWRLNLEHVKAETGLNGLVGRARREQMARRSRGDDTHGPEMLTLIEKVQQAYRILFTRTFKGVYVWIKDEETRDYVTSSLGIPPVR